MRFAYIRVFAGESEVIDTLSDTEAGRLLKALLHYINDREESLPGQENLVYMMLKARIDRDAQDEQQKAIEYREYIARQRENGKKGGRPRKNPKNPLVFEKNPENPLVFEENPKNPLVFDGYSGFSHARGIDTTSTVTPIRNSLENDINNNNYEDKTGVVVDKRNPKTDDLGSDLTRAGARESVVCPEETVEAYASLNLQHLSPTNMQELFSFKDDMPEELIRYAIDEACANGKRSWSYVRAMLNRFIDAGYKTVGDAKADAGKYRKAKGVPAAHSTQATKYTDPDYENDW